MTDVPAQLPVFLTLTPVLLLGGWLTLGDITGYRRQAGRVIVWLAFLWSAAVIICVIVGLVSLTDDATAMSGWGVTFAGRGAWLALIGFGGATLARILGWRDKFDAVAKHDESVIQALVESTQHLLDRAAIFEQQVYRGMRGKTQELMVARDRFDLLLTLPKHLAQRISNRLRIPDELDRYLPDLPKR